ncbi:hypothetical protein OGCDGJMD_01501 [Cyanobium usitatum str. Tous]|nr:hypothetical protein OGCDGJMD_01501 [Cyanobium usitatum str. Tous]
MQKLQRTDCCGVLTSLFSLQSYPLSASAKVSH